MKKGAAVTAVLLLAAGLPTRSLADEYPMPRVDYAAVLRVEAAGGTRAVMRHHDGMIRMETKAALGGEESVFLVDMRKGTSVLLVTVMGQKLAMDIAPGDDRAVVFPTRPVGARRIGADRVAGEACNVWEFKNPVTKRKDSACVTGDGISLRMVVDGRTVTEATAIDRNPQDPSLFRMPQGYQRIPVPVGPGLLQDMKKLLGKMP